MPLLIADNDFTEWTAGEPVLIAVECQAICADK